MAKELDDFDGWRAYTVDDAAAQLGDKVQMLDIFELGVFANAFNKETIKQLKSGAVPCRALPDESNKTVKFLPRMTADQVKSLWRVFTKMTEEEMDGRIKATRLYEDGEGLTAPLSEELFLELWGELVNMKEKDHPKKKWKKKGLIIIAL
jgi:hypothetical protein